MSRYEASLLARRGGLHLRPGPRAPADGRGRGRAAERARGRAAGSCPRPRCARRPLLCLGGERRGDALLLRTAQGPVTLARGRRAARRAGCDHPRVPDAPRAAAHRHRAARGGLSACTSTAAPSRAPLEIDALELRARLRGERLGPARDRRLARRGGRRRAARRRLRAACRPVLGPAAPEPGGALAAAGSLAAAARGGAGDEPAGRARQPRAVPLLLGLARGRRAPALAGSRRARAAC